MTQIQEQIDNQVTNLWGKANRSYFRKSCWIRLEGIGRFYCSIRASDHDIYLYNISIKARHEQAHILKLIIDTIASMSYEEEYGLCYMFQSIKVSGLKFDPKMYSWVIDFQSTWEIYNNNFTCEKFSTHIELFRMKEV